MENLIKIIKIASKSSFKNLKKNAPYNCTILNKPIFVSNIFYKHISGYSKNRKNKEVIERLSIMSLIEEIALEGEIFQTKEDTFYEKYDFYKKTYKISYLKEGFYFIILVGEKQNGKLILLSCFVKNLEKKRLVRFEGFLT